MPDLRSPHPKCLVGDSSAPGESPGHLDNHVRNPKYFEYRSRQRKWIGRVCHNKGSMFFHQRRIKRTGCGWCLDTRPPGYTETYADNILKLLTKLDSTVFILGHQNQGVILRQFLV